MIPICLNIHALLFLLGQHAALQCNAPLVRGGFFVPGKESFSHGTKLTYSCYGGLKPMSGGWWAASTCQNGQWSNQPQCIGEFGLSAMQSCMLQRFGHTHEGVSVPLCSSAIPNSLVVSTKTRRIGNLLLLLNAVPIIPQRTNSHL